MPDPTAIDFKHLFESSYRALLVIDKEGVIVSCNPSAENLVGFSKDELLGKIPSKLRLKDEAGRKLGFRAISSSGDDDQIHILMEIQIMEHTTSGSDDTSGPEQIQIAHVDGKELYEIHMAQYYAVTATHKRLKRSLNKVYRTRVA